MGQSKAYTRNDSGAGSLGVPCRFEVEKVEEVAIQMLSAASEPDHKRPKKARLDIEELTALLLENQKELDSKSKLGLLNVLLPGLKRLPRYPTP